MKTLPEIGTRVAFKRDFLRSCGMSTGWRPFARGVVVSIDLRLEAFAGGKAIVTVAWEDRARIAGEPAPATSSVNTANLVRADRIHLEAV